MSVSFVPYRLNTDHVILAVVVFGIGVLTGCGHFMSGKPSTLRTYQATEVRQLTWDFQNHYLSPYGGFSPDNQWLVYDTRTAEGAMGGNPAIEKVNTVTGRREVVYRVPNQNEYGPGCGTPTWHPHENKIIFLHGLDNADHDRPYDLHRRTCVMVDEANPGIATRLDARDVTVPYSPGALRGGTHAHQFSGDGQWIGFTYNDGLLTEIDRQTGRPVNLRTVGVMTPCRSVDVDTDPEGENHNGIWFSVLVARVVPYPQVGSDEISRAFDNAWVGKNGYRKADGTWQRAQAYLGKLKIKDNRDLIEVFISDIPERIDRPGPSGPLEGTMDDFPLPPEGVTQRRLTSTENKKYPGVAEDPRHWVLSSSDGKYIAYLAKDDNGIVQIFVVCPQGGDPVQITDGQTPIQSTFFWKPDSHILCYVCDNSIFVTGLENEQPLKSIRLTERFPVHPVYPCWSNDGNMIAFNVDIPDGGNLYRQIFVIQLKSEPASACKCM